MPIIEHHLSNGIKFLHDQSTVDELVSIGLFLPVGIEYDALCKGVGSFTCSMLLKGTKRFSDKELAYELEKTGMSFDWHRTDDYIHFGMTIHRDFLMRGLELFFEILTNPIFPEENIKWLKDEYLQRLKSRYDHVFNKAYDLFTEKIYGDHPYSWLTLGNESSIQKISRDDLIKFHDSFFVPEDAVITAVGNCTHNEVLEAAQKLVTKKQNLDKQSESLLNISGYDAVSGDIIREKQKFKQAFVVYGIPAPSLESKHHLALKVIDEYLGHGMTSEMFVTVREKHGLVYEIGSVYPTRRFGSYWMLFLGLDKVNISRSISVIEETLAKLVSNGISKEVFEKLKVKMMSKYMFDHQTKVRRGWYLGIWEMLGKKWTYDIEYPKHLEGLQLDSIQEAIDEIFQPQKPIQVIIQPHS